MNTRVILTSCGLLLLSACAQDQRATIDETGVTANAAIIAPKPAATVIAEQKQQVAKRQNAERSILHSRVVASQAAAPRFEMSSSQQLVAAPALSDLRSAGNVPLNRENYAAIEQNSVKRVAETPVSTFSIDVDTAAYAVVRRHLNQGMMPPGNAVRIEELINYFDYDYAAPRDASTPFSVSTEVAATPWNDNTQLVRIGLQGYQQDAQQRPAANLVFLVDVSGSMNSADKLPLLKNAFRLLVNQLNADDRITLVVYAGSSGVVLETTPGDRKGDILAALDRLSAGGSTHGSSGIQLAYAMAQQSFIEDGINRVILATDGDFNVGTVNHDALIELVERNKAAQISLTTLGFGSGNYNDHLMEQLADHGDGNYAYIDNLNEARKILVEQVSSTLQTIASDVKIQVEWNPAMVSEYRLIGYENRLLNREDFNNDRVDAGEIGAGHRVTALYEITLANAPAQRIEPLRYQRQQAEGASGKTELGYIKLRYKQPGQQNSQLLQQELRASSDTAEASTGSENLRFAAAVAAFGELLRGGEKVNQFEYQDVLKLANAARGRDAHGYRGEFVRLVELAAALDSRG